jgi:hypothetical protein
MIIASLGIFKKFQFTDLPIMGSVMDSVTDIGNYGNSMMSNKLVLV